MRRILESKNRWIVFNFLTGLLIPIICSNFVSLIYRQELSSTPIYGHLIIGILGAIPYIIPFFFRTNEGDITDEPVDGKSLLQFKASYITATILTFIVFGWSAYAEEGPYTGGGAAMSLVAVMFFGTPGICLLTFLAASISGLFYRKK